MSAELWATVGLAVGYLARLAAMWLRLLWRERRDQARLASIADLAADADANVEVMEKNSDGSWVRLSVTHHQNAGE